jgi:hypothetical protein
MSISVFLTPNFSSKSKLFPALPFLVLTELASCPYYLSNFSNEIQPLKDMETDCFL